MLLCAAFVTAGSIAAREVHARVLAAAATQLASGTGQQPVALKRSSGTHRVPNGATYADAGRRVDLSEMRNVLEVNVDAGVCVVEPFCSMEALVQCTLSHGLLPKVVPEFRAITVGGAVMGGAMESSSHRHGMFHDTLASAECLLADGTVVTCSRDERPELFRSLGGSYGTLCMLTSATIECVPSAPRVRLRFRWFGNVRKGLSALVESAEAAHEADEAQPSRFIDGVVLSPPRTRRVGYLLVEGILEDDDADADAGAQITAGSQPWSEWYYEYLLRLSDTLSDGAAAGGEDGSVGHAGGWMRVEDYLFRFDRGAFNMGTGGDEWMSSWTDFIHPTKLPLYVATNNNPVSRALLRSPFTTERSYAGLHLAPPEAIASQLVFQDCFSPASDVAACVEYLREITRDHKPAASCPIWTWPVRGTDGLLAPNGHKPGELLVNLGVYTRCADGSAADVTRALEAWLVAHDGRKLLYSNTYFVGGGLWAVAGYDGDRYDALRDEYDAAGRLPRLEAKVISKERTVREGGLDPLAWSLAFARYLM